MRRPHDDNAGLVDAAARGDAGAFHRLVLIHEARVRSFLARVVGPADADDLAQEAFVKAWLALPRRRAEGRFEPWLLSIAWHAALDHLRRKRRASARDGAWHATRSGENAPVGSARLELEQALAALSPRERAALVLTEGHGWSHSEAANMLGMPLGTLKSAVLRAKSKVLAAIEGASA